MIHQTALVKHVHCQYRCLYNPDAYKFCVYLSGQTGAVDYTGLVADLEPGNEYELHLTVRT